MPKTKSQPGLDWYLSKSAEGKVLPRCPFATADKCPRYFQSVATLGGFGFTKLDPDEDKRLFDRWKRTDVWAAVDEDVVFAFGESNSGDVSVSNFCPEVAFERFGWFASGLFKYADEIDRDAAYERLRKENVERGSWQWRWSDLTPAHYTECPLYSPLSIGVFPIVGERKKPIGFPTANATLKKPENS